MMTPRDEEVEIRAALIGNHKQLREECARLDAEVIAVLADHGKSIAAEGLLRAEIKTLKRKLRSLAQTKGRKP